MVLLKTIQKDKTCMPVDIQLKVICSCSCVRNDKKTHQTEQRNRRMKAKERWAFFKTQKDQMRLSNSLLLQKPFLWSNGRQWIILQIYITAILSILTIQKSIYSWQLQVYDKRSVVPPHGAAKYHKRWIDVKLKLAAMVSMRCGFWRTLLERKTGVWDIPISK